MSLHAPDCTCRGCRPDLPTAQEQLAMEQERRYLESEPITYTPAPPVAGECSNCRHWDPETDPLSILRRPWGRCSEPGMTGRGASGLGFTPEPTFGCNQYVARGVADIEGATADDLWAMMTPAQQAEVLREFQG